MQPNKKRKTITEIFLEGRAIDAALRRAGREALKRHAAAGQPVVVWRGGKIVEVSAAKLLRRQPKKKRK